LCGNVSITAQTIHLLCEASIPVVHLSRGHWFYGITAGITLRNAYDRAAQFEAASDPARRVAFAREIIAAKGANQRTLLLRNARPRAVAVAAETATLLRKIEHVESADQRPGIEGAIASKYFSVFGTMLRPRDIDADWEFQNRNRRPDRNSVV